jgi:ATP-dependent Clp protease adaptor protein ClpS
MDGPARDLQIEMRQNSLRFGAPHDLEPGRRCPYYDGSTVLLAPQSRHVLTRKVPMNRRPTEMTASAANRPNAPRLGDEDNPKRRGAPGTAVIKRPSLYKVLLLNDDYTPMEFVVHVLERFFNKDHGAAHRIMMHVHQHGIGECGIYTYEVAETKVTQVMDFARKHQHPLQCVMEKK